MVLFSDQVFLFSHIVSEDITTLYLRSFKRILPVRLLGILKIEL